MHTQNKTTQKKNPTKKTQPFIRLRDNEVRLCFKYLYHRLIDGMTISLKYI
jgi:hypothetical protein